METAEILKKLYFKQWVIGLAQANIGDIIRSKSFRQDITWLPVESRTHFYADPFILDSDDDMIKILFEDFSIDENYGNISIMTLDRNLNEVSRKVLLDTGSHISFPFIFSENGKTMVFPEAARTGKVSCYEFDSSRETLRFVNDLVKIPLYDPAILKKDGKYWLFGSIFENRADYRLYIFYSDSLTGPYVPHPANPVRSGLDATRAAGNFINVDGIIYRPTQNCSNKYGESITVNRILKLDEHEFAEDFHMKISIDENNRQNNNIHTIHTLNFCNDLVVVDGMKWIFSLSDQWKNFRRNRRLLKQSEIAAKPF